MRSPVHIIGGGLAGCEAAWQIASRGIAVVLHEMRPNRNTPAHQTDGLAELVCSNSFRSDDADYNAVGLLHEELRKLGSLILAAADKHKVPAGGALAVDRLGFSNEIQTRLQDHPNITVVRQEVLCLPDVGQAQTIVATGPLTTPELAQSIQAVTGQDALAFFDAIAPIVYKDSIDFGKAWFQSRYDKGEGSDYINCPMSREEYEAFIGALQAGDKIEFHEWEKDTPYFEGCLPIEIMAARGIQTLAHGPMKPVGLTNPNGPRPYAVVQLRQDNKLGTLYNLVGFQTKLRHAEQARIFRMIPGLENAEFARLGGLHRNTFVNGPKVLDPRLRLKNRPDICLAGQITGCEGYVESTAIGFLAGLFTALDHITPPPPTTALGALLAHVTGGGHTDTYQPMNINFGLFPTVPERDDRGKKVKGRDRKKLYSDRGRVDLADWMAAYTIFR